MRRRRRKIWDDIFQKCRPNARKVRRTADRRICRYDGRTSIFIFYFLQCHIEVYNLIFAYVDTYGNLSPWFNFSSKNLAGAKTKKTTTIFVYFDGNLLLSCIDFHVSLLFIFVSYSYGKCNVVVVVNFFSRVIIYAFTWRSYIHTHERTYNFF